MIEVDTFKAIGEEGRLRILRLMVKAETELCACEIIDALEKPQYTISKALGILVTAGLVNERREGRQMMYQLAHTPFNDAIFAGISLLKCPDNPRMADDLVRLRKRLAGRSNGKCVEGCP
jgi:ArsR family transcriptional regulator, arsenate/arsenite/antimonite-responsive transcriptional repressor